MFLCSCLHIFLIERQYFILAFSSSSILFCDDVVNAQLQMQVLLNKAFHLYSLKLYFTSIITKNFGCKHWTLFNEKEVKEFLNKKKIMGNFWSEMSTLIAPAFFEGIYKNCAMLKKLNVKKVIKNQQLKEINRLHKMKLLPIDLMIQWKTNWLQSMQRIWKKDVSYLSCFFYWWFCDLRNNPISVRVYHEILKDFAENRTSSQILVGSRPLIEISVYRNV